MTKTRSNPQETPHEILSEKTNLESRVTLLHDLQHQVAIKKEQAQHDFDADKSRKRVDKEDVTTSVKRTSYYQCGGDDETDYEPVFELELPSAFTTSTSSPCAQFCGDSLRIDEELENVKSIHSLFAPDSGKAELGSLEKTEDALAGEAELVRNQVDAFARKNQNEPANILYITDVPKTGSRL